MKRLHRLTSLLVKLQSSKNLEINKIAKEYEISERTIYRDLKALEEAGVPIGYEPGEGYFLLEGYQLPPIHLSIDEGYALITASSIISQNQDSSLVTSFTKVVEKLIAVLKKNEKHKVLDIRDRLAPSVIKKKSSSNYLISIQACITDFKVLEIHYENVQGTFTIRHIEPLSVYFTKENWVVVAYCRLRKKNREFRLDRIKELHPTKENFTPNFFSLNHYFKKIAESQNP